MSTTPKSTPCKSPPSSLAHLQQISSLLQLTHHRNSNQHRLAKWYKSFSQLRRHIKKLIREIGGLDTAVKLSAQGNDEGDEGEENKYVKRARERVEMRVEFLERRLVGECWLAFSNLVADNQYSALGLMLVATLARIQHIIHPLGKDAGDELVIEELEAQNLTSETGVEVADLGEVVSRAKIFKVDEKDGDERIDEDIRDEEVEVEAMVKKPIKKRKLEKAREEEEKKEEKVVVDEKPGKKVKKRRRKGGDAFDDLFAGLL